MEAKRNNDNKKIEIVKGNTKDLKISNVKDSLTFEEHKNNATKMVKLLFLRTRNRILNYFFMLSNFSWIVISFYSN